MNKNLIEEIYSLDRVVKNNMLNKVLIKYYGGIRLEDIHPAQQEKILDLMRSFIDSRRTIYDNNLGFCPWILESKTII